MKINTFKHFMVDSFKSIKRNKTISLASVATVAATLFILGVFLLAAQNIKQGIKEVESKVQVKIILKDDIKQNEQKDIEKKIKETSGVVDVVFESKKDALEKFKEQLGDENKGLAEGFEKDNPLPMSYLVNVQKPTIVTNVVDSVKSFPGIDTIKDGRELVNKLMAVTNTIKWVGIAMFAILIGVSLFLIGNTIKITLYSRRREIGIMKFIGATDWFIRWPFIIEGVIIGVAGALMSTGILYYGYKFLYMRASSTIMMMQLVKPEFILVSILGEFLLAGAAIGAAGSVLTIRKFLAV